MEISEIEDRLNLARASDDDLNEMLFARAFGWTYPLTGAGYHHFHGLRREHGKTDFTGNAQAAFTLAKRVLEKAQFDISIDESGYSQVKMSGQHYDSRLCGYYEVAKTGSSLALAVSRCALEVLKQMAEKAETVRMAG
ncbi:hypothetical protein [Rhizobium sp. BK176]|uniref:hypothetical protein n=1 Tax=Rhizobium sp. BK176 TaxID=2587071 RepID=UPI0021686548|nr:hypothetical protein [Rhizobium sp. BK176]MCS4090221.1 hypothetical protein [Rhizobium sp. BK176]